MAKVVKRKLWRGNDRGRLNKLSNALRMLEARDLAMDLKYTQAAIGVGPEEVLVYFFAEEAGDPIDLAIQLLKARVATLKALKY